MKQKKERLYKQLVWECVIGSYFWFTIISLWSLVVILWRTYDEFVTVLWSTYDIWKIGPLTYTYANAWCFFYCLHMFYHTGLCNSWSRKVQPEHVRKSKIRFTVTSIHMEATERKPTMADLSPAWNVQPDFVQLDHQWAVIGNLSHTIAPPLIPHVIHQVCHFV